MSRRSDRSGERFGHITISLIVGILGFLMAMATMNTAVRYIAMFFMTQIYTGFIIFTAWVSNSTSGPSKSSKQAVSLAFISAFSTLGHVVGS
ncbi:hypothetical protein AZE42_07776 [Rhizopogon vesiculosus]|uniref:Major facilitator superfamily (MFS) profile domain-containing protein n=1 Tax=Rhizopogon vesiculosus TaxID=180088 RepID=A0A1J8PLA8_9AGAM|nr:hypothetical protein AZE42_07776 [Rhizopogon vesiculosus]